MPKLSVVIITFNEEKNIARCIQSVQQVADEIVVLDSFSKDKTKEICLSLGVNFFEHVFDGHIQQKNRAITYAKNNHVLSLDADEALDETLIKSMLEYDSDFITQPQKFLLDNSINLETQDEYLRLCKEYNFTRIKKDNIGICGGRQFIAEHAEKNKRLQMTTSFHKKVR